MHGDFVVVFKDRLLQLSACHLTTASILCQCSMLSLIMSAKDVLLHMYSVFFRLALMLAAHCLPASLPEWQSHHCYFSTCCASYRPSQHLSTAGSLCITQQLTIEDSCSAW
jgi:hypothetical protein